MSISFDLWQRLMDGAPDAIGRIVGRNDRPFTFIGVASEGFRGTNMALARDVWVPIAAGSLLEGNAAAMAPDAGAMTRVGIAWLG